MNKKEKNLTLEIIERLTRVEEQIKAGFEKQEESTEEIKQSIATINHEMGNLEERIIVVENLYNKAESYWKNITLYWKVVSFIVSPILTFVLILLIKFLLGLPIP